MKKALVASSGGDEVSVTRGAEHRPFLALSQILAVLIDESHGFWHVPQRKLSVN